MTDAPTPDRDAERGFTITRTFDAPRQLVWDAITLPEHVGEWFGTRETKVEVAEYDVRPGGAMRATMFFDGNEMPWQGTFQEVEPIDRLVLGITDQDDPDELELLTYVLTDLGDGRTEMVFRQSGGHLTDEQYEGAREGSEAFLDSLAEVLAEIKARS
jgi:uncharacterized protein YndB with AHSA1/START domain